MVRRLPATTISSISHDGRTYVIALAQRSLHRAISQLEVKNMLNEKKLRVVVKDGKSYKVTPFYSATGGCRESVEETLDGEPRRIFWMDSISSRLIDDSYKVEGVACPHCHRGVFYADAQRVVGRQGLIECRRCSSLIDVSADMPHYLKPAAC